MTQRAICVGINSFKHYPQFALNGCVNDAKAMSALCRDLLGFKPRQVKLLTERMATKAAIMTALTQAVDAACAGKLKRILFSLSSHGTQIADASGDERDGMDEAFVPHDVAERDQRWDPDRIISDDEFNALFSRLPGDVLLEVFLDTCHSGSGLRGAEFSLHAPRPRFIAPPAAEFQGPVRQRVVGGFRIAPPLPARSARARARAQAEAPVAGSHHVLWTGCRANQTSADAWFDGGYSGAFTHHLVRVLRETGNRLPRREVMARVRAALKGNFTQVPQLEAQARLRGKPLTD